MLSQYPANDQHARIVDEIDDPALGPVETYTIMANVYGKNATDWTYLDTNDRVLAINRLAETWDSGRYSAPVKLFVDVDGDDVLVATLDNEELIRFDLDVAHDDACQCADCYRD